jgi:hypothetical protein
MILKKKELLYFENFVTNKRHDVKYKVKFTLEQATKVHTGSSTLSLTSALDEGGWSTPLPDRFSPGKDSVPIV